MEKRPTELDIKIGARLGELRISKGLTLSAFGRIMGVSFQQAQNLERGQIRLRVEQLYTLCKALDVNASSVLADIKKPKIEKSTIEMKQERKLLNAFSKIKDPKNRRLALEVVNSLRAVRTYDE